MCQWFILVNYSNVNYVQQTHRSLIFRALLLDFFKKINLKSSSFKVSATRKINHFLEHREKKEYYRESNEWKR